MSRPLEKQALPKRLLWNVPVSALGAWGMAEIYFAALPCGSVPPVLLPLVCLGLCLALGLIDGLLHKRGKVIALFALAALEGALFFFGRGFAYGLYQGVRSMMLGFSGVTGAMLPYGAELALMLSLVFSLMLYTLVRDNLFPLALGCMLPVLAAGVYLTGGETFIYAVPVMFSLLSMLSGMNGKSLTAVLLAALIAMAAFFMTPGSNDVTYAPLKQAADEIRNLFEDYFFFTDTRESFSMHSAGYQPLKDRLGGKANPDRDAVMQVEGAPNEAIYLRASSMNMYTGLNWYDTLSGRRYLYTSRSFETLRREIFDENRPMTGTETEQTVKVTFLNPGSTTLFVPQRLRSVETYSDRMVPYYNDAGEVYITRNTAAQDRYTAVYLPLDITKNGVRDMIAENALEHDANMALAVENYLTVPPHIQQEVWDIAHQVTYGLTDPLDKALAIRNYLQQNYAYDLEVPEPPSSVDFTAYFLLGPEKAGYCTYFASAQTILCRMAGVPARYTVGYLAKTDENGQALLTGRDAHAWTEVYLNGFGWLTLDATPGNQQGQHEREDHAQGDPETMLSPTPTPTPTPSPAPHSPSATPTPEDNDAPETPTPEPAATPENIPEQQPTPPPDEPEPQEQTDPEGTDDRQNRWWWLLLLLAAAAAVLWLKMSSPESRVKRKPHLAAFIYTDAGLLLLRAMKLRRGKEETLSEFALRCEKESGIPLKNFFAALSRSVYGRKDDRISSMDARMAENAYRMLLGKSRFRHKAYMRLMSAWKR